MSNTSIRPIPTLKGMFSVPRVTPGRNFLKENKKSLRTLEKTTTEKLAAKEPVRPKWMPPLHRTSSEDPDRKPKRCETERSYTSKHTDNKTIHNQANSRSQHYLNRSQSQSDEPYEYSENKSQKGNQVRNCPSATQQLSIRCQSCDTERSSTSIGIQTEDIMDEAYLGNALKKCNIDSKSVVSLGRKSRLEPDGYEEDNYGNYNQYNDEEERSSERSETDTHRKHNHLDMDENEVMPIAEENLNIDNEDEDAPLSARSRETIATVASNVTTKSKRREHKLGSRDDLRLPRYLEKEKREKAVAKELLDSRDPDCPRGHVLMSEQERLSALGAAKHRFGELINELNHMPMTAQTLRVRARRAEIDKELSQVEDEIRIYSKTKVYVKASNSRNL